MLGELENKPDVDRLCQALVICNPRLEDAEQEAVILVLSANVEQVFLSPVGFGQRQQFRGLLWTVS